MDTIQMHLCKKQKIFSQFFSAFSESALNFITFSNKEDLHRLCISESTDHEKRAKTNV